MTRKSFIIGAGIAAALAVAAWGYGSSAIAQTYGGGLGMMGGGYGMMGGMIGRYGPGHGAGFNQPGTNGYGTGWMHGGRGYGFGWMHGGRGYGPGYGDGWMHRGGPGYGPGYGRGW